MDPDDLHRQRQAQINRALGIFLLFFGLVVLSSILFTKTAAGRATNLVAGAILVSIGAVLVRRRE